MKGSVHPPESSESADPFTDAKVRQITRHPSIHHHPFYYLPPWDDAMQRLIFVSHRTGRPEVFAELRDEGGRLLQVTCRPDLDEWSIHPSHDGRFVYFTACGGLWRANLESLAEECLARPGGQATGRTGTVGAAMGTTSLSRDDHWWAVPVRHGKWARLWVVDTGSGEAAPILERETVAHPQFHPDDPGWLRYGGPYHSRIRVVRRDGTNDRLSYTRDEKRREWIVHETWRPSTREILTVNWPHGILSIDVDSGTVRPVASFNAWHPMIDRTGRFLVTDTNFPDTGLHLLAVDGPGAGEPAALCATESSNAGHHWETDHCPYDDGPVEVYAPQHTHPHPAFSPDGSRIVFTSDRTGTAQLYEVRVPPLFR